MKPFIYITLMIVAFGISTGCGHRSQLLHNPQPITVSSEYQSADKVRNGIRAGLKQYQWIIESDQPGRMVARYSRKNHLARVEITYNYANVNINYVTSENLLYRIDSKGQARIHTAYNGWVSNLERAIASHLS